MLRLSLPKSRIPRDNCHVYSPRHAHCNTDEWSDVDVEVCQGYGETAPIESYLVVLVNVSLSATGAPTNLKADLTNPVKFSDSDFEMAYRTTSDFDGNHTDGSFFG
jgi:hypothetical protein